MTESSHYSIPKEPGGRGALLLAVLAHLVLVAFLWVGVSWQSQEHAGVEAEVWDMQTREAAPKAVAEPEPVQEERAVRKPAPKHDPKPEPVVKEQVIRADIALAQEKKRKDEVKKKIEVEKQHKLEDDKRKKTDADKKKKEADDKRKQDVADQKARDKLRAAVMRSIAGATGTGDSGTAPHSTGNNRIDTSYGNKVGPKIRSNTAYVVPDNLDGNPAVEYAIELLPDGSLRTRPRKLKSSGLPGFDDAVLRAIEKSVPFPPDKSGKVPTSFTLSHQPKA